MAAKLRLLGFTEAGQAGKTLAAMATIPGPAVQLCDYGCLTALGQPEADRAFWTQLGNRALSEGLRCVQMRLERACLAGPFLPMDPAASPLPASAVQGLMASAQAALTVALDDAGQLHQWDLVMRWPGEEVVAAHRSAIATAASGAGPAALAEAVAAVLTAERERRHAALLAVITPVARATRKLSGGPAETGLTVLVRPGGEAAIEAALARLPDDFGDTTSVDLKGPLPPVSFAAIRLCQAEPGAIAQAWRLLDLPARVDAPGLRAKWLAAAAHLHPDLNRAATAADAMVSANQAYALLRTALAQADGAAWTMQQLQRRAARHFAVPSPVSEMAA
jgi:hypothetical protein